MSVQGANAEVGTAELHIPLYYTPAGGLTNPQVTNLVAPLATLSPTPPRHGG